MINGGVCVIQPRANGIFTATIATTSADEYNIDKSMKLYTCWMGAWPKGIVLLLVAITRVQAAFYARSCMIKAFQTDGKLQDKRVFSQMGEDGIIEAMHRCIDREFNGTYVEFGTESCRECTSRHLREKKGWKGLLMDGGYQDESINLHKEMIAYDNIVSLFQKYKVPMQFDLLMIDLDLNSSPTNPLGRIPASDACD